jgi:6-phosphogluconolactonase
MRRWAEWGATALGVCALGLATGCNGFFVYPGSLSSSSGGSTSATGDYVYVANATTGTLAGFSVGTGTLTAVSGSPYSLGFAPTAVVVNPANSIVFVAGTSGLYAFINAYSISATGTLSLLTSNNVGSSAEVSMDVSPDGNWLIGLDASGANLNEAILDEYEINTSSGQLSAELGTGNTYIYTGSIPTIVPRQVKFSPNGAYVFAAMGTAGDLVFPFNTSSGSFSSPLLLAESTTGTSDNALAVNSASSYLYIARSGNQGGLAVYTIGAGGALSEIAGSPLTAGNQPFSVVVNKAGTAVYVANQLDSTISGYSISTTGVVAALSTATDVAPAEPRALAIGNSGSSLLSISNAGSPDLAMFSYDSASTGKLDLANSLATGTDPAGAVAIAATH